MILWLKIKVIKIRLRIKWVLYNINAVVFFISSVLKRFSKKINDKLWNENFGLVRKLEQYKKQIKKSEIVSRAKYEKDFVYLSGNENIARYFEVFDLDNEITIKRVSYADQTHGFYTHHSTKKKKSVKYFGNIVLVYKGE